MEEDEFLTIDREGTAEIRVQGSRFIGTAGPATSERQAIEFVHEVSRKFYNATHQCFAYIIGHQPFITIRCSDAGEPVGTGGLPILNVIKGKQLSNIAVVVSRYFGGTKLGKGGLVRAYGECTQKVLQQCPIIKQYLYEKLMLEFDYKLIGSVMRVISLFNAQVHEAIYNQNSRLILSLRKSMVDKFKFNLIEATSAKISITKTN